MIRYIGIFGTHQENINPFKVLLILGNGFALNGDVGESKLGNLKGIVILPSYSDPLTPYFLSNYNKKGAIHIKLLRKISFMDIKLKKPLPIERVWVDPGNTLFFTYQEI